MFLLTGALPMTSPLLLCRPFKVWLIIPVVFCIIAFLLVIATLREQPVESAIAIAGILTAIPVYYAARFVRKRRLFGCAPQDEGSVASRNHIS